MPKSTYLSNNFVQAALLNGTFTGPTSVWVALFTVPPGVGGGGIEVLTAGTSYARVSVSFSPVINGQTSNTTDVNFPIASGTWGTVVAFGLYDASVPGTGNLLYFNNLSSPRTVLVNDQMRFPAGQLQAGES